MYRTNLLKRHRSGRLLGQAFALADTGASRRVPDYNLRRENPGVVRPLLRK